MKRNKDDMDASSSQDKPPLDSSPNEPPEKTAADDARSYLMEVKETFHDQKHKYTMLLKMMEDFKRKRIGIDAVVERVKELLKGHNNLILGFNNFLPKGYEITLDEEEAPPPKKEVEFEVALRFVEKVKKRFEHSEHAYKSFLDNLHTYRNNNRGSTEVYNEISTLFEDHSDLLEEFTTTFCPNALAPHTTAQSLQSQAQPKDAGGSGN